MYGSAGVRIKLFATGVAGGKENTEYRELSVRADAIVVRSVVIAGISQPYFWDRDKGSIIL
jgi:hypothetical protein